MFALILAVAVAAGAASPAVSVQQENDVYTVSARFVVPQSTELVAAVLTDYADIPRFMPDVTTSIVRERTAGRAVVEQEAYTRVAVFSKRVHLVLEIDEAANALRFRDRCGRSFTRYEGSWRFVQTDAGTEVVYQLLARPSFDVPDFLLSRVLRKNAAQMIQQLRNEIAARAEQLHAR